MIELNYITDVNTKETKKFWIAPKHVLTIAEHPLGALVGFVDGTESIVVEKATDIVAEVEAHS